MEANKAFGGIDILINNAGAYEEGPWMLIAIENNGLGPPRSLKLPNRPTPGDGKRRRVQTRLKARGR